MAIKREFSSVLSLANQTPGIFFLKVLKKVSKNISKYGRNITPTAKAPGIAIPPINPS